jgi:Methyltransferase domain
LRHNQPSRCLGNALETNDLPGVRFLAYNRGMARGLRWLRGELHDRFVIREGIRFGRELPELDGGDPFLPGHIERYFEAHTHGPGIYKWRHYFPIYERHLSHLRGRPAHLVEIGVLSGGSLLMWCDYLGPNARVTGVDIEPACNADETGQITVVIGDQGDPGFWGRFLREADPIDAVIDDGSHHTEHQIATLKALLPHLRAGGVYICEDVQRPDNEFARFIDGFTRNLDVCRHLPRRDGGDASDTTTFQRAIASVHRYPFVIVVERTQAPVHRFEAPRRGTEWPSSPRTRAIELRSPGSSSRWR